MTYCLAIRVNDGLVFAADTRTSAGLDDVRTYNKMHHFEVPGERCFVMLSAGNLATTQAILVQLERDWNAVDGRNSLKTLFHMFDVAEYVGQVSVKAQREAAQGNPAPDTGDLREDLAHWLRGDYAIPGEPVDPASVPPEADARDRRDDD